MGVEAERRPDEYDDEVSSASSGPESESGSSSEESDGSSPNKRRKLSRRSPSPDAQRFRSVARTDRLSLAPPRPGLSPAAGDPREAAGSRPPAPGDFGSTFESLGIRQWLVQSLKNMAITKPTGIQKGCIPEILKGRDCIGGSRTGSGKTVAFAVPILQTWADDPMATFALILTPTRSVAAYHDARAYLLPRR
jgi:ATP-dependent RNA helicase DDX49/DBP8